MRCLSVKISDSYCLDSTCSSSSVSHNSLSSKKTEMTVVLRNDVRSDLQTASDAHVALRKITLYVVHKNADAFVNS